MYHRRSYFCDTFRKIFLRIQFFAICIHAKLASGSAESLQNLRWRERHGCDLPVQFLRQRLSLLPERGREKESRVELGRRVEPRVPAGDE